MSLLRSVLVRAAASFAFLVSTAACSSSSSTATAALQPVEVKTAEGPVRGEITDDIRAFKGIPYAAPPTGPNRWKKPQPVTAWTEVRETKAFGKACTQPKVDGSSATADSDEDCLYVNVWTPAKASSKPRPVMVWIHGGAFTLGAGAVDASKLVRKTDNIVVAMNYRLGALGFMAHSALGQEDGGRTGNYGLYDQRAALEWVKRNAASFGGDPANVTIFGESAGGQSVSAHYLAKGSFGLFHRAVVQSGAVGYKAQLPGPADADKMAADLGAAVGCTGAGAELVSCLRGKPAGALVVALKHANQPPGGLLQGSTKTAIWIPTIDGTFIEKSPLEHLTSLPMANVPMIVGTTAAEGGLFHAGLFGDIPVKTQAEYEAAVALSFGSNAQAVIARYPASGFKSFNDALARLDTIAFFTCPARVQARAVSKGGNPVFVFEHRRVPVNGTITALGAVHSSDLTFLFDEESVAGGAPGEDGRPVVDAMQTYWGRFAAAGDPNGAGALAWPRFDATEPFVALDVPLSTGTALAKDDCDFIDTLGPLPGPKFY